MKQYEKILILCSESEATHRVDKNLYKQEIGSIVLTIEELREVCRAVVSEWVEVSVPGSLNTDIDKDLDNFLKSKWVQL